MNDLTVGAPRYLLAKRGGKDSKLSLVDEAFLQDPPRGTAPLPTALRLDGVRVLLIAEEILPVGCVTVS